MLCPIWIMYVISGDQSAVHGEGLLRSSPHGIYTDPKARLVAMNGRGESIALNRMWHDVISSPIAM